MRYRLSFFISFKRFDRSLALETLRTYVKKVEICNINGHNSSVRKGLKINLPKYVILFFLNSFFLIKNERGILDLCGSLA